MESAALNAVIYDFDAARRHPGMPDKASLSDTLRRIERCCQWLSDNGLTVLAFRKPLNGTPYVMVSDRPAAYILFSGRVETCGHRQEGALRYIVREGIDRINQVAVRWVEVIACA